MTLIQKPYYSIHFLKSEEIYFDRRSRPVLLRTAHLIGMLILELLQNLAKAVANAMIWIGNRGSLLKNEGRVVIIGSGPAGYTAAIYLARANLSPLMLQGSNTGGQLMTTHVIENYPGFPQGIKGPELMDRLEAQAKKFGTEMRPEDALQIDFSRYPYIVRTQSSLIEAKAILISTGASAKRLDVPGTRDGEFWQKGVSSCAVCDGPLPVFRNQPLFVIGGGDSALEEALYLSKFASKVYVVHRREQLRASQILIQRVKQNPKVEILYNRDLAEVKGSKSVEEIVLKNNLSNQNETYPARGVFIAIGHTPNTKFLNGSLETDSNGYLRVTKGSSATSAMGVFACGDVQDPEYRQAISAAGTGCMAAIDAEQWLTTN
jgi:thioredoxin reductase (NADPH)